MSKHAAREDHRTKILEHSAKVFAILNGDTTDGWGKHRGADK